MRRMFQAGMVSRRGIGPFLFLGIILAVMIVGIIYSVNPAADRDVEVETVDYSRINNDINFVRTDFDPKVETWGIINDGVLEGQQDVPVTALKKAIDIVSPRPWNRMRFAGNVIDEDVQGFASLDVEKAFSAPNKMRGLPVEVVGRLDQIEPLDLFDTYTHKLPDGRFSIYKGSMRCRKGKHKSEALVHFMLLDELDPDDPILVPGAEVKMQGVFFKLQRYDTENGPETGIWILAKRVLRSYKLPTKDEIDLSLLTTVKDAVTAEDSARDPIEERAFHHLLAHVHAGLEDKNTDVLKLKGRELRKLLHDPEPLRGQLIEFGSRVMRVDHFSMNHWYPEHNESDNPINEFWISYVTPDDNFPMSILWLTEPPTSLKRRDQVRMKAKFYRVWGFKSKAGLAKSPLLVGVGEITVENVELKTGLDDPVTAGLIGFSLLVLILVIVILRFDRRRAALFSDTLAAKKKLQRKRGPLLPKALSEAQNGDQSEPSGDSSQPD